MLRLFEHNVLTDSNGVLAVLDEAMEVTVTEEINGERRLVFLYPVGSEKYDMITLNRIVYCEGQPYKIIKQSKDCDSGSARFECEHVYNFRAKKMHLQTVGGTGTTVGASPIDIMRQIFRYGAFSVMSEEKVEKLGMKWVGSDGFRIDLETMDKVSAFEVMEQIIACCGKGEIYADGYDIALVERIGADKGVRLDACKNMQEVSIERDISGLVTWLYPYGRNDLDISEAQNNGGKQQYIISPGADIYGKYEGYRDYDDITDPDDLFTRALWEFDEENDSRIDLPTLNISGNMVDPQRQNGGEFSIRLGDTVIVNDMGNEYKRRVVRMEYRPYEARIISISVGNVKRDMYFYLKQLGKIAQRYKGVYTSGGKIRGSSVSGTVENAKLSENAQGYRSVSGAVMLDEDMLSVAAEDGSGCDIGVVEGSTVFYVKSGNGSISKGTGGLLEFDGSVKAQTLSLQGFGMSTDTDGNLYFNGKKIKFEEADNGVES